MFVSLSKFAPPPRPTVDVTLIPSPFGGFCAIAQHPAGSQFLEAFFDAEPLEIAPLGGAVGWIVEPFQMEDLAAAIAAEGN